MFTTSQNEAEEDTNLYSNYSNNLTPLIGEVYWMEFNGYEHGQKGWRPGVVLQNNVGNLHSPNLIALPLTTVLKKVNLPTHVVIPAVDSGLFEDSMVLCENPVTMSKRRVGAYLTTLPDEYMGKIARANLLATASISFLGEDELLEIRQETVSLNSHSA